jgi:hypothetical protein
MGIVGVDTRQLSQKRIPKELWASQFVTVDFEGVAVTGFSSRDGGRERGIGFNAEATRGAEFTET